MIKTLNAASPCEAGSDLGSTPKDSRKCGTRYVFELSSKAIGLPTSTTPMPPCAL